MIDEQYSLVGVNGNAYAVMGYTAKAMRKEGFRADEIESMQKEAKSGDYDNLLQICIGYVDKCNERYENRVYE